MNSAKLIEEISFLRENVTAGPRKGKVEGTFPDTTLKLLVQDYSDEPRDFGVNHLPPVVLAADDGLKHISQLRLIRSKAVSFTVCASITGWWMPQVPDT